MTHLQPGWMLPSAAVLIIIVVVLYLKRKKAADRNSGDLQGEIFQPYLAIGKHERKDGIKHIVIKNSGKGRANHCRIENPEECFIEFRITGNIDIISGGTLKLSGRPKSGLSSSSPGKYKFTLYYKDENGEEYKILVIDEGEGNGPQMQNAFL